jgi:prepilin-type processing-associated H-X9-DG protein
LSVSIPAPKSKHRHWRYDDACSTHGLEMILDRAASIGRTSFMTKDAAWHRRARLRRASTGFTLPELLIIVAIVAILGAILFPIVTNARAKSQQSTCLSNQRQLSTAWLMYSQDYNGRVVPWSVSGKSASDAFIWDRLLQAYQKNEALLRCPSTSALVSYSYSANVGGASPSPPTRSLSSLKNPTQTPIIADCAGFTDSVNNVAGWSYSFVIPDERNGHQARAIKYVSIKDGRPTGETQWFAPPTNERTEAAMIKADMHRGGANYIFADGHAQWLAAEHDATGKPIPVRKGMDYDSDGILGDDPAHGTSGKYD